VARDVLKMTLAESRYELLTKLAAGGMGTVYVGRLRGAGGFRRLVAIKRAHPHLLEQPLFGRMLVKEAELASAIHHPNAVAVLDVEELDGELLLVMDYVDGVPLSRLLAACDPDEGDPVPPRVAVRIVQDVCAGLHACHTCCDDRGEPLGLVHRDVSPQNVLVGADGQARLSDFGIAKSLVHDDKLTQTGTVRGKTGYMAPEYALEGKLDQRSDVFAVGVVLWEALAGRRLYRGNTELETLRRLTEQDAPLISSAAPWLGSALDDVLTTALRRDPDLRFRSAEALGRALEEAAQLDGLIGRHREVADEVETRFGAELLERRKAINTQGPVQLEAEGDTTGTITAAMGDATGGEAEDTAEAAPAWLAEGPSTLEASTLLPVPTSRPPPPARRRFVGWLAAAGLAAGASAVVSALVADSPLEARPGLLRLGAIPEPAAPARDDPTASATTSADAAPAESTEPEPEPTAMPPPRPITQSAPPSPTPTPKAPPAPSPAPPPSKPGLEAKTNPYAGKKGAQDNPFAP
jgi:eukaryotic-like serine/threonine-protein kinase